MVVLCLLLAGGVTWWWITQRDSAAEEDGDRATAAAAHDGAPGASDASGAGKSAANSGAAARDAERARELAPPIAGESFSRFTGRAWYVTGMVHERNRRWREAREAFATAAVQFAGALGEEHPDTLLARAGIERLSASLTTQNYN